MRNDISSSNDDQDNDMSDESWLLLIALLTATFLGTLDTTIVNIGLHTIQLYFGVSVEKVQLIGSIYIFVFSSFLIMGGKLGDRYGHYFIFNIGVVGFLFFSICCASATQFIWLVSFRGIQAVCSAIMIPQVLAIIRTSFKTKRDVGISLYGVTLGAATIGGMIIGGYIIGLFGWRSVFILNVPFCILILLKTTMYTKIQLNNEKSNLSIDYIGPVVLMVLMIFLITPLSFQLIKGTRGLFIYITISIALITSLIYNEYFQSKNKNKENFIPLFLFKNNEFLIGTLTLIIYFVGTSGYNIVIVYYLQDHLHLTQFSTGNISSTLGLGFMIGSIISERLIKRYGHMIIILGCFGMIITRVLMIPLSYNNSEYMAAFISIFMGVTGVSQGLIVTPIMNIVMKSVTVDIAGVTSGALLTACNLSIAIGQASFMMLYGNITIKFGASQTLPYLLLLMVLFAISTLIMVAIMLVTNHRKQGKQNED